MRVLVDTNIVLDALLKREPWAAAARLLWEANDAGRMTGYLNASALTDIFPSSATHFLRSLLLCLALTACAGPALQGVSPAQGADTPTASFTPQPTATFTPTPTSPPPSPTPDAVEQIEIPADHTP